MTDRVVTVSLLAKVNNYVSGMEQARKKNVETSKSAEDAKSKFENQSKAMGDVGRGFVAVGALAAVGLAVAIKAYADFDAKMSQVKTLSHATADEMNQLTNAALTMGQAIGFSASEVADAQIELVKAGVSVKDILGGALQGALQLAAAGQIDVAQATEIATIALTQFSLKGKDIPHVADLLAAGADKALGGVGDLGEALKSGGLVAAQFGVSLDETVGTLSAFANAGLIGEQAGTVLRQMLLQLASPSTQASELMKSLGINIYDASGQFVGLSGLAGILQDKLGALTPAQRNAAEAIIFGAHSIAGANVLYKEGAKGISTWTGEVNDSGFAAKQAAGKMDNLKGDVTKLGAAFTTGLIEAGSSADDVLRSIVQSATGLISMISSVPAPVLAVGMGLLGLVAIVGLVGGTALITVPKIFAFKTALEGLKISAGTAVTALSGISVGLVVAGAVFAKISSDQARATASTQAFQESLDESTGAVTKYTRELVAKRLEEQGAFDDAKKYGVTQKELTDAVLHGGSAMELVRKKIADYTAPMIEAHDRGAALAGSQSDLANSVAETTRELTGGEKAQKNVAAATKENTDKTQSAAEAYKAAADQAATLQSNLTELIDTINKANGVGQDAVSANADYKKALNDVDAAIKNIDPSTGKAKDASEALKRTLDESTLAGSANAAMLADLASKGQDAAEKQFALSGDTDEYTAALAANHQAVYDAAIAMGATADQAQALADKVAAIPTTKQIQILADTSAADKKIGDFYARWDGKQVSIPLVLTGDAKHKSALAAFGIIGSGFADGGMVPGRPSHQDNMIATVASGEFITRTAQAQIPSNRAALEYMNRGGVIRGYANGGFVQPQYARQPQVTMVAAPSSAKSGVSAQFTLNEISDPIGTATAIVRRLSALGA